MQNLEGMLVIATALVAANIPFFSNTHFLVFRLGKSKRLPLRLVELALLYALVGALAVSLEIRRHGSPYPQGWAFYAVTTCLFMVFAFPGFVARYLWRGAKHD